MKPEILRVLLESHFRGDEEAFRKAALQLAASEGNAGHTRIAEELRAIIANMPPPSRASIGSRGGMTLDIAQPRGELAGLLTGGFRQERLKDVVLRDRTKLKLERVLKEHRHRPDLESWGISASRKLLFYGPPGCGKTLTAAVIAGELGLPLMTVRFDGLFSRFLGATAGHLKVIFDEMPRRFGVYLFDEFDAVAKSRGDSQEVGEIQRVLTSFLQLMDADTSQTIIVAATNFEELLDRAVFRRFDMMFPFALPTTEHLERLIRLRLNAFAVPSEVIRRIAARSSGLSFADAARACDDAIRSMVLARRRDPHPEDLEQSFASATERIRPPQGANQQRGDEPQS